MTPDFLFLIAENKIAPATAEALVLTLAKRHTFCLSGVNPKENDGRQRRRPRLLPFSVNCRCMSVQQLGRRVPGRRGTTGRVFARPEVLFHLGLGANLYEELLKQLMRESKPGVG